MTRVTVRYTWDEVLRLLAKREDEMRSGSVPVLATVAAQRVADAFNDAAAGGFAVELDWGGADIGGLHVLQNDAGRWVVGDEVAP